MYDEVLATFRRMLPAGHAAPLRVEYLPGGYSNRNYRIETRTGDYALRIVEHGPPHRHERRYLDIPAAPDVVAYDAGSGHLLTRWIDGQLFAQAPPTADQAGAYLAALHGQIPAGVRAYRYEMQVNALLRGGGRLAAPDVVVAHRLLDWRPRTLCGCHNDLNPWNVIRVATSTSTPAYRTLDWEFAGDNDPLFDLAGLALGLRWNYAQACSCLASYRKLAPTTVADAATPARLRDALVAYRIREYAWAVAQIASGNDREEIEAQATTMRQAIIGS